MFLCSMPQTGLYLLLKLVSSDTVLDNIKLMDSDGKRQCTEKFVTSSEIEKYIKILVVITSVANDH